MLHDDRTPPREQFTADEVAEDIMMYGFKNFDYTLWKTLDDSDKAEAFDELVATIASYKYEPALTTYENHSELLSEIKDSMQSTIEHWAKREINRLPRNGLEKDE